MNLSEETKLKILEILDSKEFMLDLYEGLDEKKRIELGQFYTPGKICIQMIEKFTCDTLSGRNILDPTCGSGNLLIACLIAGASFTPSPVTAINSPFRWNDSTICNREKYIYSV